MPLSEQDRRRLEQIEQALLADDPSFVDRIGASGLRRRPRMIMAGVLFTAGMILLVAGLVSTHAWLVVGVVVSLLGALLMAASAVLIRRQLAPS